MNSTRSSAVKERLDALGLVEDEEYSEVLRDVSQNLRIGGRPKKVYMLTPEAFKTCLMRVRKYPRQTVDPATYSRYYLLLEKTHKLNTDYEKHERRSILGLQSFLNETQPGGRVSVFIFVFFVSKSLVFMCQ
jgi:hypothetical protein